MLLSKCIMYSERPQSSKTLNAGCQTGSLVELWKQGRRQKVQRQGLIHQGLTVRFGFNRFGFNTSCAAWAENNNSAAAADRRLWHGESADTHRAGATVSQRRNNYAGLTSSWVDIYDMWSEAGFRERVKCWTRRLKNNAQVWCRRSFKTRNMLCRLLGRVK